MPHPAMGTARDYCRHIQAILTPYLKAITVGGIDLSGELQSVPKQGSYGVI